MKGPWIVWALPLLLSTIAGTAFATTARPSLDACAELVRDHPGELLSYRCYWFVARQGDPEGASRALESLLAIDPGNHRARLYLAAVRADLGDPRAETLYRDAGEGFAEWGDATGEVYARLSLCALLRRRDEITGAAHQLELAEQTARDAGDPILLARVRLFQATGAIRREAYGEALELLRQVERAASPGGPVDIRSAVLSEMGYAYWAQGLLQRAREAYSRQADLIGEAGDPFEEATARLNAALVAVQLYEGTRMERGEVLELLERVAREAASAGNRAAEAKAHLLLGEYGPEARALEEAERSRALYAEVGKLRGCREASLQLADVLWRNHPRRRAEAMRLLGETIAQARSAGDLQNWASGLIGRAEMLEDLGERDKWIPAYGAAIDAVERIREAFPEGEIGARLSSRWVAPYYELSDGLLSRLEESPDREGDLDLAFRTVERMRSRILIEELLRARTNPRFDGDGPNDPRRREVIERIEEIQKRLADPALPQRERSSHLEELERLEMEEVVLRRGLPPFRQATGVTDPDRAPSLGRVRELLGRDQAILSYQIPPPQESPQADAPSGGWVLAITREQVRAFPLPERETLREQVRIFLGLCRRRDGQEARAAEVLYEQLLARPLRTIGPAIHRLVIVPDDCLHRIPFAPLLPDRGGKPLGVTHEICRTPSLTLWTEWKAVANAPERAAAEPAALALADPLLPPAAAAGNRRAGTPWIEGLHLERLRGARSEARALVRAVGGASRMVTGEAASERFLEHADLSRFSIVHLAAHAIVDEQHPERSAVVLTPGGEGEDGFLQLREIAELEMGGKIVLLSGCRSASGTLLPSEGVLGLARAFFQAGARAVVGSLWPLRDDEASALMRELSRGISEGRSLSGALAQARAARIEAGAPTEAWAGLVLLGDGDLVPLPDGRPPSHPLPGLPRGFLLLAGLLLAALLLVARLVYPRRERTAL